MTSLTRHKILPRIVVQHGQHQHGMLHAVIQDDTIWSYSMLHWRANTCNFYPCCNRGCNASHADDSLLTVASKTMADDENNKRYKSVFISFMCYIDQEDYGGDAVFAPERLAEIQDVDVAGYFNLKAYGTPIPTADDRPTSARSNSLLHYKKAISWFMPNRNHTYNEITKVGNPTKSQKVNDVIKRVKRFEARKQGSPSKAHRALKEAEF